MHTTHAGGEFQLFGIQYNRVQGRLAATQTT
jgi:hypothetical protein